MAIDLELPQVIWAARDAAIDGLYAGSRDLPAEKIIKQWIEGLDGNLVLCEFSDAGIGLILPLLYKSDLDVCDDLSIDSESSVNDADRAAYVRKKMEQAREDAEGPYLDCYTISDDNGRSAFIGVKSYLYGQGEIEFVFLGLFSSRIAIIQAELDAGILVDSWIPGCKKFDDFTDKELAEFFRFDV